MYDFDVTSGGMIYIPVLTTIDRRIRVILGVLPQQLERL
jgi:hypothetical protein